MNPASIVIEGVKVAKGKESRSNFALYILMAVTFEALMEKKEGITMDAFYIPSEVALPAFIIMIACAICFPVIIGMYFKNESKYAGNKWTGRYIATVILDMFVAPSLGLILLSLIVQQFFPEVNGVTYLILLPLTMAIVAYYALLFMNQGTKGLIEQLTKHAQDAKDIVQTVQDIKPKE